MILGAPGATGASDFASPHAEIEIFDSASGGCSSPVPPSHLLAALSMYEAEEK